MKLFVCNFAKYLFVKVKWLMWQNFIFDRETWNNVTDKPKHELIKRWLVYFRQFHRLSHFLYNDWDWFSSNLVCRKEEKSQDNSRPVVILLTFSPSNYLKVPETNPITSTSAHYCIIVERAENHCSELVFQFTVSPKMCHRGNVVRFEMKSQGDYTENHKTKKRTRIENRCWPTRIINLVRIWSGHNNL